MVEISGRVSARRAESFTYVVEVGFGHDPRGVSNELEGTPAPAFKLQSLDGQTYDLAALKGSPVVLNYWATWCIPCAQEHSHLMQAARVYEARGVVFLGMLYGDEPDTAREFLSRRGQAYPVLIDPENGVAIDYGVTGVPETFFIDREGKIALKVAEPLSFGAISSILESLL